MSPKALLRSFPIVALAPFDESRFLPSRPFQTASRKFQCQYDTTVEIHSQDRNEIPGLPLFHISSRTTGQVTWLVPQSWLQNSSILKQKARLLENSADFKKACWWGTRLLLGEGCLFASSLCYTWLLRECSKAT